MTRLLAMLAVLFLAAGCADTPDESWYDWIPFVSDSDKPDSAVSADRIPDTVPATPSAPGPPRSIRRQRAFPPNVPPRRPTAIVAD